MYAARYGPVCCFSRCYNRLRPFYPATTLLLRIFCVVNILSFANLFCVLQIYSVLQIYYVANLLCCKFIVLQIYCFANFISFVNLLCVANFFFAGNFLPCPGTLFCRSPPSSSSHESRFSYAFVAQFCPHVSYSCYNWFRRCAWG